MTHKDIYTKFMIEYDKANVTSSYPSLTEYEVATILGKAYNALIAQKVTGNNIRRVGLEGDLKSTTDIKDLIVSTDITVAKVEQNLNVYKGVLPTDYLYFVTGSIAQLNSHTEDNYTKSVIDTAIDNLEFRKAAVILVNHQIAQNFIASPTNLPWVKHPVAFVEGDEIYIVVDPLKPYASTLDMSYVKTPNKFVKNFDQIKNAIKADPDAESQYDAAVGQLSYFDAEYTDLNNWGDDNSSLPGALLAQNIVKKYYEFECNDTVAEELINLAVAFALENVESQRLNSKLNMRGLEA